jgi:hypothetical protein
MFGSQIVDLAIGVVLFFLFVSLLCSSAREAVETVLRSRARDLERGLRMMLDDPQGVGLVKDLLNHGQIASLLDGEYDPGVLKRSLFGAIHVPVSARKILPAYLPAEQFATALLDLVGRGPDDGASPVPIAPVTIATLRAQVLTLPSVRLQRVILTAIDHAEGDLEQVRANIEAWFNGSMDRVSGWYKQRTQVWLFFIGLAAAVLLNLDSITVIERLQNDEAFRQATVAGAQTIIDQGGNAIAAPAETNDLGADLSNAISGANAVRANLTSIGYPIGWRTIAAASVGPAAKSAPAASPQSTTATWLVGWPAPTQACTTRDGPCTYSHPGVAAWLLILLGWGITALAATFGAPFWFDVLNRFMVVRSTVKPQQKSKDEASADPTTPAAKAAPAPAGAPAAAAAPPVAGPGADQGAAAGDTPPFEPESWRDGFVNIGEVDL